MWLMLVIDFYSVKSDSHQAASMPLWLVDGTLYLLALFQIVNIALLVIMASRLNWGSSSEIVAAIMNLFTVKVVVGTSSSFSGIVVAHEFLHRRESHFSLLGRFLLALSCYEHFSTEHLRGHHYRVGTEEDAATARFGETFRAYWRRTLPAQFKSAWRLECGRLNLVSPLDARWLRHRVLQGILVEGLLIFAIAWFFGPVALFAFLLQAGVAVQKLEAVNYIEHWGLSRRGSTDPTSLSWDSDSWFTLHTLTGLSQHADHHHSPGKPYPRLTHRPESPKLPYGYFCMVFLAISRNDLFQRLLTRELESRCLGPFAAEKTEGRVDVREGKSTTF
ncbi:MAG: fatty acid desaturase [Pseudomonadota bacterium]